MKVLVNALSTTNLSGRHVLLGHLDGLAARAPDRDTFFVLFSEDIRRPSAPNVVWMEGPRLARRWWTRILWERTRLPGLVRRLDVDVVFTPSGMVTPGIPVPQVCYAMNPWALVPGVPRGVEKPW